MNLRRLPITARVPLIITLFMMTVSSFASERVLSRLIETQTRQVQALADTYVDGLALALVELDGARRCLAGLRRTRPVQASPWGN